MNPSQKKAQRLGQIEVLLLAHPNGLRQAEIARRLGVHRATINRYLPDLPASIYVEEDGRWKIDANADLIHVTLNLHEALALHLATRLLANCTDRQNPHAGSALRKLHLPLARLAPRLSQHLRLSADEIDAASLRQDPVYLEVLETLTHAWAKQQVAQVWRADEAGNLRNYRFAPYFIEPYAAGRAIHAIGWRDPPGALRTLKIERLQRAELLAETYAIPEDFDYRTLLQDAWGIWFTEREPVEVVLRFAARAAKRVQESRWHRSEQVEWLADGRLIWRARIADPHEMHYWIRGWGEDVEVLAPAELRQTLAEEAHRTAALYDASPEVPHAA